MTEHTDVRVVLQGTELYRAADVVSQHFTSDWLQKNTCPGIRNWRLTASAAAELITNVLRCVNTQRLGQAEDSIARHPDGRTARRYYSEKLGKLQWLITEPVSDANIEVNSVDELPENSRWQIVYIAPWNVR